MDTGNGSFVRITEAMAKDLRKAQANPQRELRHIFREGEVLEIRGSKFRVERIKTRGLRLLLLPFEVKDEKG